MKDIECISSKINKKTKKGHKHILHIAINFINLSNFIHFSIFLLFPIPISPPSVITGEERGKSPIAKRC